MLDLFAAHLTSQNAQKFSVFVQSDDVGIPTDGSAIWLDLSTNSLRAYYDTTWEYAAVPFSGVTGNKIAYKSLTKNDFADLTKLISEPDVPEETWDYPRGIMPRNYAFSLKYNIDPAKIHSQAKTAFTTLENGAVNKSALSGMPRRMAWYKYMFNPSGGRIPVDYTTGQAPTELNNLPLGISLETVWNTPCVGYNPETNEYLPDRDGQMNTDIGYFSSFGDVGVDCYGNTNIGGGPKQYKVLRGICAPGIYYITNNEYPSIYFTLIVENYGEAFPTIPTPPVGKTNYGVVRLCIGLNIVYFGNLESNYYFRPYPGGYWYYYNTMWKNLVPPPLPTTGLPSSDHNIAGATLDVPSTVWLSEAPFSGTAPWGRIWETKSYVGPFRWDKLPYAFKYLNTYIPGYSGYGNVGWLGYDIENESFHSDWNYFLQDPGNQDAPYNPEGGFGPAVIGPVPYANDTMVFCSVDTRNFASNSVTGSKFKDKSLLIPGGSQKYEWRTPPYDHNTYYDPDTGEETLPTIPNDTWVGISITEPNIDITISSSKLANDAVTMNHLPVADQPFVNRISPRSFALDLQSALLPTGALYLIPYSDSNRSPESNIITEGIRQDNNVLFPWNIAERPDHKYAKSGSGSRPGYYYRVGVRDDFTILRSIVGDDVIANGVNTNSIYPPPTEPSWNTKFKWAMRSDYPQYLDYEIPVSGQSPHWY